MMHFKFNTGKFHYWPVVNAILWLLILFYLSTGSYEWFLHHRHLDWHEQVDFIMLNGLTDAAGLFLFWLFFRWIAEKFNNKTIELTVKPADIPDGG